MHHYASQFDDGLKIRYSNSKKYYVKLDEYKIDSIPASIPSLQKKGHNVSLYFPKWRWHENLLLKWQNKLCRRDPYEKPIQMIIELSPFWHY